MIRRKIKIPEPYSFILLHACFFESRITAEAGCIRTETDCPDTEPGSLLFLSSQYGPLGLPFGRIPLLRVKRHIQPFFQHFLLFRQAPSGEAGSEVPHQIAPDHTKVFPCAGQNEKAAVCHSGTPPWTDAVGTADGGCFGSGQQFKACRPFFGCTVYSVRSAMTGSFFAASLDGMMPAISVSRTEMPIRISA